MPAAQPGEVYAIYDQGKGKDFQLDLRQVQGRFKIEWLNPREGGAWQSGSVDEVEGGKITDLGQAPDTLDLDWCCMVRKK